MLNKLNFLILSMAFNFQTFSHAAAPNAVKILENAEKIRNPQEDYQTDVKLIDRQTSKTVEHTFQTSIKGRDKALVKYLTPAIDKGTKVLLINNDMWIYVPSSAKPIRIAPQQKIAGNAAYGDVARLNFVGNYTPKFVKEAKHDKKSCYVLDLKAIDGRPVTYSRVEYWVEKSTSRPMKAIYMTDSGKAIREATFADYKNVLGTVRPTKMILVNAIQKNHTTELSFENTKIAKLSDLMFDRANLSRD